MNLVHFTLVFLPAVANGHWLTVNEEWPAFKLKFHKVYGSPKEEAYRKEIFGINLDKINVHNEKYETGNTTYNMGINQWTDLTALEAQDIIKCLVVPPEIGDDELDNLYPSGPVSDLPEEVDWRKEGIVTRVKNQMACGSCWAFSATGMLEGQRALKTNKLVELSEQELVDCSWPQGNAGCLGGFPIWAFRYVLENDGISREDEYNYANEDSYCHSTGKDPHFKWMSYRYLRPYEDALQAAVAKIGPISVAIKATTELQNYQNGIFHDPDCNKGRVNHGILVVGYGTGKNGPYWIVKNSWGTTWGQDGFGYIARNANNMCFIASYAAFATGMEIIK